MVVNMCTSNVAMALIAQYIDIHVFLVWLKSN